MDTRVLDQIGCEKRVEFPVSSLGLVVLVVVVRLAGLDCWLVVVYLVPQLPAAFPSDGVLACLASDVGRGCFD